MGYGEFYCWKIVICSFENDVVKVDLDFGDFVYIIVLIKFVF